MKKETLPPPMDAPEIAAVTDQAERWHLKSHCAI
jgi:hypothetical protein